MFYILHIPTGKYIMTGGKYKMGQNCNCAKLKNRSQLLFPYQIPEGIIPTCYLDKEFSSKTRAKIFLRRPFMSKTKNEYLIVKRE